MQRFALLHDDSPTGWHASYLAFHVAARLGAPLQVFLADSTSNLTNLNQRSSQVEISGRAAGVTIETRSVKDFSAETLTGKADAMDGLFIPRSFVPDGEAAAQYVNAFSCPIWIVSKEAGKHKMAVLVSNWSADRNLFLYTTALSHRLEQTLVGLVRKEELISIHANESAVTWIPLPDFSASQIAPALEGQEVDVLFVPASHASFISEMNANCVIYPARQDA